MELISSNTCISLLTRYNQSDNAEAMGLIRYYVTEESLVVIIRYKTVDLKSIIDRASITDIGDMTMTTAEDFITTYLQPPMPIVRLLGEESTDINLTVSKV